MFNAQERSHFQSRFVPEGYILDTEYPASYLRNTCDYCRNSYKSRSKYVQDWYSDLLWHIANHGKPECRACLSFSEQQFMDKYTNEIDARVRACYDDELTVIQGRMARWIENILNGRYQMSPEVESVWRSQCQTVRDAWLDDDWNMLLESGMPEQGKIGLTISIPRPDIVQDENEDICVNRGYFPRHRSDLRFARENLDEDDERATKARRALAEARSEFLRQCKS